MTLHRDAGTLPEALERAAGSEASLGFVDRRERIERLSWAVCHERTKDTAGRLQRLGVRAGDRVGLVYPTGPEFLQALLGTLLTGAVPVPLYPPVRLGRLEEYHDRTAFLLRRVGAELLLVDRRTRRVLGPTVEKAGLGRGCRTLEQLPPGEYRPRIVDSDELALVQFSSGTTVEPKPVALTHHQILAQVRALNSFWPPDGEHAPSGVSWLPLYHDMGLVGCVFTALDYPGDLTLIPPEFFVARPSVWLRVLSKTRAVISPAPNFAYGLCVDKIRDEELEGVDLSNWRVALCGAETVVPEVLRAFTRRFERWGFRRQALSPVYGLSEAALAVTFSDLDRPFVSRVFARRLLAEEGRAIEQRQPGKPADGVEIAALGRPLPGFSISIRDSDGKEMAGGGVGTVWARGPSLMSGYLGPSGETVAEFADGWLDTGDRGFVFSGELYLTGRAKDIIIVRGRNHSPEEVELALDPLPGVRTGCTAAVGHLEEGAAGESLWVFVEQSRGVPAERRGLATACRRAIFSAAGLEVERVVVLEPGTLPRTSSGKIRRQETLHRYLAGDLLPPGPVNAVAMLGVMLRSRSAMKRAEKARRDG
ncbi:MAG: AMP-binding protein [Acidobacteriota bacterium]|nr:AMP-binding protein [Acidobacteriota bacterium]